MNNLKNFVFIVLAGCLTGLDTGCTSRSEVPRQQPETVQKRALPPAPLNLPPGTVRLQGEPITAITEGVFTCRLKVVRVIAYGMSTPPIAIGSEIEAEMDTTNHKPRIEQYNSARQRSASVLVTLRSTPGALTKAQDNTWKIIDIQSAGDDNLKEE